MAVTVTVEDGSVVSGANSYISVADATTYFDNRPDANWTAASADEKGTALIKATDYLVERFRDQWMGYRLSPSQTLDWPRQEVFPEVFYNDLDYEVPDNEVPQPIKDVTCVLAAKVLAGTTLNDDITRLTSREKVGDLEVEYFRGAMSRTQFVAVTDRLKPYLVDKSRLHRV